MSEDISVAVHVAGEGVVELVVVGEIDVATAPTLRGAILDAIDRHHPTMVLVDLGGVGFMDSTGIGALVAGRNHALECAVQFRVRRPQPVVLKVLQVTGLEELFLDCPEESPQVAGADTQVSSVEPTTLSDADATGGAGPFPRDPSDPSAARPGAGWRSTAAQ